MDDLNGRIVYILQDSTSKIFGVFQNLAEAEDALDGMEEYGKDGNISSVPRYIERMEIGLLQYAAN